MEIKKIYHFIKIILLRSPKIGNRQALIKYNNDYNYTPKELNNYFDGELSILILNKNYRGRNLGKKLLQKVFRLAKKDNMKNLQILTDESCNFQFYEQCGCTKIYETLIPNSEPDKNGDKDEEIGYIFEKKF